MKILVPLDGSDISHRVIPAVQRMLRTVPNAEFHLLMVLDPREVKERFDQEVVDSLPVAIGQEVVTPPGPRQVESHGDALQRVQHEAIEELHVLRQDMLANATTFVRAEYSREPAKKIAEVAAELGVTAIAMATHGRSGISHLLAGSVTEEVIRHATIPVLVIGPSYVAPKS